MQTASRLVMAATRVAIAAAALACGGGSDSNSLTNPPVLTSINVSLSDASLAPGETSTATASGVDQNGSAIATGTVAWSSSAPAVATVSTSGVVTAVGPGTTQIIASADGKSGAATLTVTAPPTPPPVASVTVSPATATLLIGTTQQLTATTLDASGNQVAGRTVTWSSSDPSRASVSPNGLVQAIAAGTATIVATSETKSGSATITVSSSPAPQGCTTATAVQMGVGEIRTLTSAQIASLCLGGLTSSSEYVMIPFNNSNIPSATTELQLTSTGTIAVTTAPNLIPNDAPIFDRQVELAFRARERRDVGGALRARARVGRQPARLDASAQITGVPSNPAVGSIVQINSNLNGSTCSAEKILTPARVVAVLPRTILLIDTLAPAGGYTDGELVDFATAFDTLGYAIDTTNFGAVTDIDNNGRVAILFTPGINRIPAPPGATVGGLFAARDLFPVGPNGCVASNEGEMFYMPVPDPNQTINSNYRNKTSIAGQVAGTLVHELQHLINAGRRIYVNEADQFEEVWLNEGLSHIGEELLYYRESGNAPLQNIDAPRVRSSATQVGAFNRNMSQNFGRVQSYLAAPSTNSPYDTDDGLEVRGAIWQLLRYAADHKGGDQRTIWRALVNTQTNGQTNFNAVLGDIVPLTRNWAIAQFVDDLDFTVAAQYTNPSWNFRSIFGAFTTGRLPLATQSLVEGTNVQVTLIGGGAAYVRFGVNAGVAATVAATSASQAVPPNVSFSLVRTR